jgi:hypothetical protein
VENLGTGSASGQMRRGDVFDRKAQLGTTRVVTLAFIERKVQEGTIGPRGCCVTPTDPSIVSAVFASLVIGETQVETEPVSVEVERSIEVLDLKHRGHETHTFRHAN